MKKKSVEELPISLPLYRRAREWVEGFARIQNYRVTKERVDSIYKSFIGTANTLEEIQKIIRYQERMGWLPKGSYKGKRKSNVRHHGKTV